MIRVGVDAWNLPGDHRGIGRYVRSVLRVWRERYADRIAVSLIVPEWHTWTVGSRYRREVDGAEYPVVSRALHGRAKFDALWFPWNGCSWTSFDAAAVATLHDATNFVIPGYAPQTQAIFRGAVQHCRRLITDSVFSRFELARVLQIAPERLTPIPLGVDAVTHAPAASPRIAGMQPYILFVGQTERRKGIDTLLAAFTRVREQLPELRLVLAGERGDAVDAPIHGVVETGYVDDEELHELYAHAAAFAFPSLYEGFGLPVLESMAYGTPVVATRTSAIPEVAGEAAALVPPGDIGALAHALERVVREPLYARQLSEAGRARAALFPWERTAAQTLAVIEEAAR